MKILRNVAMATVTLGLALGLSACSGSNAPAESSSENNESTASTEESATASENSQSTVAVDDLQPNEAAGNVLVAYFSQSGNTEEVAQVISDYTTGDLAEIQRAEEYGDLQEEAEAEILDGVQPEITVSVDNVEAYDTIFVGYPIWWDEAPAMIASFLANNDFAGKRIVPFCTSSSDEIDNSLHIFPELAPDAVIEEGLTANDLDDIPPWLVELEIVQ